MLLFFFSDFCIFQDLTSKKLIGVGRQRDGIYHYRFTSNPIALQTMAKFFDLLWYMHMGHASFSSLFKIPYLNFNFSQNHVYDIFIVQHKLELLFLLAIIKSLIVLS